VLIDNVAPEEATIFDPKAPGGRSHAPLVTNWPYHQADILDEEALASAFDGVDVVIHLAAWPTGDWDRVRSTMSTNVMGTLNVLEVGRVRRVRRVVNASSINAFGTFYWRVSGLPPVWRRLPVTEDEPVVPEDPYSLSKAVTELLGQTYGRAFRLEVANLRFAGVVGQAGYERWLEEGLPATETWDDLLWGWIHIADVTQGIVRAATVPQVVPEPTTLAAADTRAPEPTLTLLERFRPNLIPHLREPLDGRASLLSIARARALLG
jgi:UDP-glucose 4-epimerase